MTALEVVAALTDLGLGAAIVFGATPKFLRSYNSLGWCHECILIQILRQ